MDLPPIEVVIRSSRGAIGVRVRGEVDAATVRNLRFALAVVEDAAELTVDLSSTQFIDIAGVRALAACAKRRRALGLELLVLAPPPAAEWILKAPPFARAPPLGAARAPLVRIGRRVARNGRWMPHGSHREHQSSRLAPSLEVTDSLRRVRKRIAAGEHGRDGSTIDEVVERYQVPAVLARDERLQPLLDERRPDLRPQLSLHTPGPASAALAPHDDQCSR